MLTFRVLLAVLCALALAPVASAQYAHFHLSDETFVGYEGNSATATAMRGGFQTVGSVPGCRTQFLDVNFSSRGGVKPRLLVLHYTVSSNRAGWGDIDLIRGLFNRNSFDASSTYLIDFEGNCKYIVDEGDKPWTQTFYNPWSISVEIIANGNEPKAAWLASKGLVKTAQVFARSAKRWGIPIRWVNPSAACVTPPAGITDHNALDCQNSHTDVKPNFPYTKFMSLVRAAATASAPKPKCQFKWRQNGGLFFKTALARCGSTAEGNAFRGAHAALGARILGLGREGKTITVKRERG